MSTTQLGPDTALRPPPPLAPLSARLDPGRLLEPETFSCDIDSENIALPLSLSLAPV